MANNRIPRNAKKIYITWKVDTTGNKAGDRATVEKTERGWIETAESGKTYYMPLALLRNTDAVQVDQIETDEPNNRKDVLLSDIGTQVYIIDGASRTDKAAQAVITALCNNGRITGELAERAKSDRPTLDKIKRNLLHVQMEERETETGMRWTFYTESGVYMDISAYSRNYIRADKQGNLYPTEAPTEPETSEGKEDTTTAKTEPQEGTESRKKTADDTTHTAGDTTPTEGTQEAPQTAGTSEGAETTTQPHTEPPRAAERAAAGGSVSQSDRRTRTAAPQSHESGEGIQRHHRPPKTSYRAIQSAATIPARYHHAQTTTRRGSPKICISWG